MPDRRPPGAVAMTAVRTAQMLIERHGADALAFAEAQIERLSRKEAPESVVDWRTVVEAIKELQAAPKKRR